MFTAKVITVSDRSARGERPDESGPALVSLLEDNGYDVLGTSIVPDEIGMIKDELLLAAGEDVALILTTGGTGFAPRDVTPEATEDVIEKKVPGIPEAMRAASMKITSRGCLSRGTAGILKNSLIINLPGSPRAAVENIESVLPAVLHGLKMLREPPMDCAKLAPGEQ